VCYVRGGGTRERKNQKPLLQDEKPRLKRHRAGLRGHVFNSAGQHLKLSSGNFSAARRAVIEWSDGQCGRSLWTGAGNRGEAGLEISADCIESCSDWALVSQPFPAANLQATGIAGRHGLSASQRPGTLRNQAGQSHCLADEQSTPFQPYSSAQNLLLS
jgi:hypothetical protein